jgi:XTP/dITP diphosphohydrolase
VGFDITTAQMDPATKDVISHRGKALRAIAPKIAPFIGAS